MMNFLLPYFLLSLLLSRSFGGAAEPLTVAILDFEGAKKAAQTETSLLEAKLSDRPQLLLLERAELEKILTEQQLSLSGAVSGESAVKIGELTGSQVLVTGRMFENEGDTYLTAKIMSTETGRVFAAMEKFSGSEGLDRASDRLADKITDTLAKRADQLVAKVETEEAHVARLRKLVEGKTLPSVSVVIAEQHFGRRAVDPAAQTELQKLLAATGFKVVVGGDPADVAIKGEAFSEYAGTRGGMIFARARVEITAVRRSDSSLVQSDRQTAAGMDLGEMIAGKDALQNAASKLTDRVVVALAK